MTRKRPVIITHATAATVLRWATTGPKRVRRKYRNALTLCRIVYGRYGVVMGTGERGIFGDVGWLRVAYGWGHVRDCGPTEYWANGMDARAAVRRTNAREARADRREEHSLSAARRSGCR